MHMIPLKSYTSWFTNNAIGKLLFNRLLYLVASFTLFIYAIRKKAHKYRPFIIALTLSSILYYVPYVLGSLTEDYRFTYWNMFAVIAAIILVFVPNLIEYKQRKKHA